MSEFIGHKQPKTDIGFGDMVKIEMYRYYSENEHFIHKVIGAFGSNAWIDTPLKWDSEITLHDHAEEVLNVVQCGLDETKVIRVAKKDVIKMDVKPTLNENQQIVLDWLKAYTDSDNGNGDKPISAIWYMMYLITGNAIERRVRNAYFELTRKQQIEVLQAFAEWGLNHERD
ncbi:hypothetical protein AB6831_04205 [Carnobacterium divergens]|uniref:hypothetical protein n=1 Tax=Carnobacterium divergens TaxID=2748 RepID=UPI0039C957DF